MAKSRQTSARGAENEGFEGGFQWSSKCVFLKLFDGDIVSYMNIHCNSCMCVGGYCYNMLACLRLEILPASERETHFIHSDIL